MRIIDWSTDVCSSDRGAKYDPPIVNLRIDNDLFGAEQRDQGYSHGFGLTLVSPNLVDYTDDPCLPRPARWLNRHLERLAPDGFENRTWWSASARRSTRRPTTRART